MPRPIGSGIPVSTRSVGSGPNVTKIRIIITYKNPPWESLKTMRQQQKIVLRGIGWFWHGKLFPKHFETGAGRRYHYKRRTWKTVIAKRERFGHNKPLVKIGAMEKEMERKSSATVTSTSKGARVKINGPWYLGYRGESNEQPDKRVEATALDDKDMRILARELNRRMWQAAGQRPVTKRHVITGSQP